MRVTVTPQRVELTEDVPFTVSVHIVNTGDLIGGYHLRVLGADPGWVRLETENLSLFPDTSETVHATISIPRGLSAGDRRIAIQVRELTPPQAISVVEVDILVPSRQAVRLALSPMTVICGATGRFGLVLENTGNTVVSATPVGLDPEQKIEFTFIPPVVTLAPGEHVITDLRTKAKRRWFGTPVVRTFGLGIAPDREPLDPFGIPGAPPQRPVAGAIVPVPPKIDPLATGSMLQKARLARGVISLLSLLLAVTVFAVVITIALSRLVGVSAADRDLAIQVAAARQSDTSTGTSTLGGKVTLLTDGSPAAGVAVELFDAAALTSPVTSTATNDKGVWTIPSLAEGSYKLRFRGAGFAEIWYPKALTGADAQTITLAAGQQLTNLNIVLGGLPATVSGTVVGDDVAAAVLTVSIPAADLPRGGAPPAPKTLPLTTAAPVPSAGSPAITTATAAPASTATTAPPDSANGGAVVQTVPIGSDGTFSVNDLPSPAVYDLTVSKPGFATATQRIDLAGGEDRKGVQLRLRTGDGVISGIVTGPDGPLPKAVVTATIGKTVVTTVTLTERTAPGTFTLRGLVTPGTYTVTVTKENFTTVSSTLTLAAGQKLTGVRLAMAKSAGSLSGTVTLLPGNAPAPGVAVVVTSGATTVSTVTQSTGTVGGWTVAGLPIPGAYTVTFSRADLQSQTVAVSLDVNGKMTGGTGSGGGIAVGMTSASAIINGTVTQRSANGAIQKVGEAVVTLSSGTDTYKVTSASLPASNLGHYEITGIVPGTYTLSVNRPGTSPTSVIVTLVAGQVLPFNPVMIQPASLFGTVTDQSGGAVAGLEVDLYQAALYPATVYRTTTVGSDGSYNFADVNAPQAYVVEVRSPTAGSLGSASVVIQPSTATRLNLTIGAPRTSGGSTAPSTAGAPAGVGSTTPPSTPVGAAAAGPTTSGTAIPGQAATTGTASASRAPTTAASP